VLLTIEDFCEEVDVNLNRLVDSLTEETGRSSPEERQAWAHSLVPLSRALAAAQRDSHGIGRAQIYLSNVALEYRLPSASAWCDAVLLGEDTKGLARAVIVELKHWQTEQDKSGPEEGLIYHKGRLTLHPAEQVRGYTEYCRRFHSAVLDLNAEVDGCVFFTRKTPLEAYLAEPHSQLCSRFPVFCQESGANGGMGQYLGERLVAANTGFADAFVRGRYKQDRNILVQVAGALRNSADRPFQLVDRQLEGFHRVMLGLRNAAEGTRRHVIVVQGPPGSGKSALAVNLWIEAALNHNGRGNVVFVSTSSSQNTNWGDVFDRNGGRHIGSGMVLKANDFKPPIGHRVVERLRRRGFAMSAATWRENLKAFEQHEQHLAPPASEHFISVVDEAHALMNPDGHKIGFPRGWYPWVGPQAFHIIRNSQVSVFLMDGDQSLSRQRNDNGCRYPRLRPPSWGQPSNGST
jgi:hypothetical protein